MQVSSWGRENHKRDIYMNNNHDGRRKNLTYKNNWSITL